MRKTVLVSGASGVVGYGILKSLSKFRSDYHLIGTTIYKNTIVPAFADVVERVPPTSEPSYLNCLSDLIKKHAVDAIIPGIECDMFYWNTKRIEISESGAQPILNNSELIRLCEDKWEFYNKLNELAPEYAIPTISEVSATEFEFPLILKPRKGYGSKGVVKVESKDELEPYRHRIGSELMMQPFIGEDENEFTVSGFFDSESTLVDCLALRRILSPEGYTVMGELTAFDFAGVLSELGRKFCAVGPTNFQFRIGGSSIKLLEINPRISSACSMRAALGYNEVVMSLEYFLGGRIPRPDPRSGVGARVVRYLEDFVFHDRTD